MPLVLFRQAPKRRLPLRCSGMSSSREFLHLKAHVILPEEGWNDRNFRSRNGVRLIQTIVRSRHAAVVKGMRSLSVQLKNYFEQQINAICDHVEKQRVSLGYKNVTTISTGAHEDLWARAIADVLGDQADVTLTQTMTSPIQSVSTEMHRKVSILMGTDYGEEENQAISKRVKKLASQVKKINATTRKRLSDRVTRGIQAGNTVYDTVKDIRKAISSLGMNRIPTIVRTMMGRAADEGMKQAYKDSEVVTFVSVIGCIAEEPTAPTYHGVCTCNIQDVPVADVDELEFHINHTGSIVPSQFAGEDGDGNERPTPEDAPDPTEVVADQLSNIVQNATPGELPPTLPADAPDSISDLIPISELPNRADDEV